jgi:TetR/AcrR family transcriptional repressor of nem operon
MSLNLSLPKRPRGRPASNGLPYANTREQLIRSGIELLTRQGVSGITLDDILKQAEVPKGSFYHYFASKDALVAAALNGYADYFIGKLEKHFSNPELAPLARLAAFVDDACRGVERYEFTRGCLVGNLGQEVGCLNETLHLRLEAILQEWECALSACLQASRTAGELSAEADCDALSHAFWVGWEGAILRARLLRSTAPMRAFFKFFLQALPRPKSS